MDLFSNNCRNSASETIDEKILDRFKALKNAVLCNSFLNVFFENACFISKPPIFINRNEEGKLHSIHTKAIEFADGYGEYYVQGIRFDESDFEKYFKNKPTPMQIMEIRNQEQKAVLISKWGLDYVLSEIEEKKLIDSYQTISKITNKLITYELYRIKIEANVMNVWIAEDHSKHTKHAILCPMISDIDGQEIIRWSQAGAWSFEMTEEEYLDNLKDGES